MKKEIIEKIEAYLECIEELELPKHKVCIPEIAREIAADIAPLVDAQAQDFAGWICHQVIVGRTYHKLWLDYCEEKSIIPLVSTDSPD